MQSHAGTGRFSARRSGRSLTARRGRPQTFVQWTTISAGTRICGARRRSRMSTPETASVLQEPQRSGAGERPKAHPSSAVLIASPGAGLRTRIRESLEGVCATHEVAQWETLDRTISSVLPSVVLFDM